MKNSRAVVIKIIAEVPGVAKAIAADPGRERGCISGANILADAQGVRDPAVLDAERERQASGGQICSESGADSMTDIWDRQ